MLLFSLAAQIFCVCVLNVREAVTPNTDKFPCVQMRVVLPIFLLFYSPASPRPQLSQVRSVIAWSP